MIQNTRHIERRLGDWMRALLPQAVSELIMFVLKLGWASLFGGLFLIALIVTNLIWQADWPIARYDALFGFAVVTQILFLLLRLETLNEAKVILLFHLTGTAMEIFKVNAGSWAYPGDGMMKIWNVPLFSGFMYASVGSFMARAIRVFEMQFAPYPPFYMTVMLACGIYLNFFSHHFVPDIRLVLFTATVLIYAKTWVWFKIGDNLYRMPFVVSAVLSAFFLWVAENIGVQTKTWIYFGHGADDWVPLTKMGAWYLLLFVSFVTVTLVSRQSLQKHGPRHPPD